MPKKFKMRPKPGEKPAPLYDCLSFSQESGSLADIFETAKEMLVANGIDHPITMADVCVDFEYRDDWSLPTFSIRYPESDSSYARRLAYWENEVLAYGEWAVTNAAAIRDYEAAEAKKAKEAEQNKIHAKRQQLEQTKHKLKKLQKELEKELSND